MNAKEIIMRADLKFVCCGYEAANHYHRNAMERKDKMNVRKLLVLLLTGLGLVQGNRSGLYLKSAKADLPSGCRDCSRRATAETIVTRNSEHGYPTSALLVVADDLRD